MIARLLALLLGPGLGFTFAGAILVGSLFNNWRHGRQIRALQAELVSTKIQRDSLAVEWAVARARADGWTIEFGVVSPDSLRARLEERDARLAADLSASNIRAEQLVGVVAVLRDSVASVGQVVQTPVVDTAGVVTGVWEGEVVDDLLTGHWLFRLPEVAMGLAVEARCPADLLMTRSGDGRTEVFARGRDPRCTPEIESLFVDPPPPVIEYRRPGFVSRWGNNLLWGGAGFVLRWLTEPKEEGR